MPRIHTLGLASVLLVTAAAACSGEAGDAADSGACFTPFDATFNGFRSWTSFSYDAPSEGASGVHITGPRTEYIKAPPAHGSTSFPVGTVIVKEIGANDPLIHHVFAMVKRGCGFNAGGAKDWEWMELTESPPNATILWHGAQPPAGENYLGDPTGCNTCHGGCTDNDYVCSPKIRLSSF